MTRVRLTDITLRENAKAQENTLSFKEMIEISKILDRLHLDTITLAPIVNVKVDSLLVRTIASAVKNSTLSIPVGFSLESVDDAWNAVCNAVNPRLCVEIPVSIVQMEFVCRQKPADVLNMVSSLVKKSREYCADVEFAALDATRSEMDFLIKTI